MVGCQARAALSTLFARFGWQGFRLHVITRKSLSTLFARFQAEEAGLRSGVLLKGFQLSSRDSADFFGVERKLKRHLSTLFARFLVACLRATFLRLRPFNSLREIPTFVVNTSPHIRHLSTLFARFSDHHPPLQMTVRLAFQLSSRDSCLRC